MRSLFQLALLGALAVPLTAGLSLAGGSVALRAGTVHTLGGNTYTGGATVLVVDGKVVAVGKDVQVPGGVRTVDYGADAVIVPGLVAADSSYNAPQDRARSRPRVGSANRSPRRPARRTKNPRLPKTRSSRAPA